MCAVPRLHRGGQPVEVSLTRARRRAEGWTCSDIVHQQHPVMLHHSALALNNDKRTATPPCCRVRGARTRDGPRSAPAAEEAPPRRLLWRDAPPEFGDDVLAGIRAADGARVGHVPHHDEL